MDHWTAHRKTEQELHRLILPSLLLSKKGGKKGGILPSSHKEGQYLRPNHDLSKKQWGVQRTETKKVRRDGWTNLSEQEHQRQGRWVVLMQIDSLKGLNGSFVAIKGDETWGMYVGGDAEREWQGAPLPLSFAVFIDSLKSLIIYWISVSPFPLITIFK